MDAPSPVDRTSDPLYVDALGQLRNVCQRGRLANATEYAERDVATNILGSLTNALVFAEDKTMKDAAHAALAILQGILRDMFHTTWAHDIRETVIERFDYDVFDGVRFDITVELAKLKTMLANKQLDQDAYDTQCTRLTLLYAEIPGNTANAKPVSPSLPLSTDVVCSQPNANVVPSHLNANVVPSQPNADVDLYAGYPKFVQDMFTLEQLKNAYSHPDLWPHHSFIETTRTSEIGMCLQCAAIPSVMACVYSDGREACIRCQIQKLSCSGKDNTFLEQDTPRPKRRRIATVKVLAAPNTPGLRNVNGRVQSLNQGHTLLRPGQELLRGSIPATSKPFPSSSTAHTGNPMLEKKQEIQVRIALVDRQLRSLDVLEQNLLKYGPKALHMHSL
ncbi:hypothetical protein BDW22DRAFT_1432511 [Trametopsis cervina]|nr:hypothetical protein BDW22DRAFT_1432511 [Trametopsis cervina]